MHTISGAKANLIKKLRTVLLPSQSGFLSSTLTGKERKWMKQLVGPSRRRMGFRTYTGTAEVKAEVSRILAEREDITRADWDQNSEFVPLDTFSEREKIKVRLWNQRSESEKEYWRTVAEKTEGSDKMAEYVIHPCCFSTSKRSFSEERIYLAQKLLVRAAEALSGPVGMHVMIYTSYLCEGVPFSTS